MPVVMAESAISMAALAYLIAGICQSKTAAGWSKWRTVLFLIGSGLLAWGLLPQYLPFKEGDFCKHVLQHLLIGMLAPLGLVMAAPITLVLRTLPSRFGRAIMHTLRSPLFQIIANPVSALMLDLGGMAALYFTPLYSEAEAHPTLHGLIHLHFIAAGCLYTWVIAGPIQHRIGLRYQHV